MFMTVDIAFEIFLSVLSQRVWLAKLVTASVGVKGEVQRRQTASCFASTQAHEVSFP